MRETDDPLLDGPVPAPPGAKLSDVTARSANDPTYRVGEEVVT